MSVKNKLVVINGSARLEGNTAKLIQQLLGKNIKMLNLVELDIAQYSYQQDYSRSDDFMLVVDQMLTADLIILATPVYWFTMSGHMKAFLDRWTDLISSHKSKGRSLAGKKIALIAQSSSESAPQSFSYPISATAQYLDMNYLGSIFWDSRTELTDLQEQQEEVNRWLS